MVRDVRCRSRRKVKKAMQSRAFLNGVEVTSDCYYADDRRGIVRLLKRSPDGHAFVDRRTGEIAREERRGRVVIARAK